MFNVTTQIVIWVANRNSPLNDSAGILTISEDGNLVILNGQKEMLWSSGVSNSVANSSARLSDTGNLVLRDNSNGRVIWQSFEIPMDTFVSSMRQSVSTRQMQLTSWRSPSDPSTGSFSCGFDPQRIPEIFIWNNSKPYWRSGPWNGNVFIGLPRMRTSYQDQFHLVDENTGSAYMTYYDDVNDSVSLFFVLNSSGVVTEKILYYGDSYEPWSSLQSECDVYGNCGPFGSCDPQGSPICSCLKGFEPKNVEEWNRGNWTGGCLRKALLQCQRRNSAMPETQFCWSGEQTRWVFEAKKRESSRFLLFTGAPQSAYRRRMW